MGFKVVYKASVEKDLKKIDKAEAKRILNRIESDLAKDPDKGAALSGTIQGLYRYRIGDYRVICAKTVDGVLVLRIGHRKDIYRV
ncbi:MAG: type II toxin-antitoxin system RelE/ParE family toxin [Actinobacteria bacterium]|nr:type II toxin-antitoxin system RelE/ParE family toxin [Actinomycetota bacterium]